MRATVMYAAGDVRVENVPDARVIKPTDALVAVSRAWICGSDLWPYESMEPSGAGVVMRHEAVGVVEAVGPDFKPPHSRGRSSWVTLAGKSILSQMRPRMVSL